MQDSTKQKQEINVTRHMAKRTAKNSVFLDLNLCLYFNIDICTVKKLLR